MTTQGTQAAAPATQNPSVLEVLTLEEFTPLLVNWHNHRVQLVMHMQQIPEGTEMTVGSKAIVLQGDALEGFKAGLAVALSELGTLPFRYSLSGEDATH
jgi:hypothetical protein